ncbi:hypothetical protein AB0883_20350 [Micromonospora sp. NPDC047812]|uniref:hypothetical protein n=1 Tax=Micromonospora sp. NPDC047812 TaxID=3155742 RepID=UPI00345415F5
MSIEWLSRVNRGFLLRDALDLTGVRLAGLTGWPDARGRVEACDATRARLHGGPSKPVGEAVLNRRIDPDLVQPAQPDALTEVVDVCFEVSDWEAAVLVSVSQFGLRTEDPETGMFAWVTPWRTSASMVLGIAATLAFAECGGGEVIDESGRLSESRLNPPTQLYEQLRARTVQESPEAAVNAVLNRTRLRWGTSSRLN